MPAATDGLPLFRCLDIPAAKAQLDDEAVVRDILTMVQASLVTDIPAVDAYLSQGNLAGAQGLLHPLKGYIPLFSVPALAQQLTDAEKSCKGSDVAVAQSTYATVRPELEALLAEIATYLATPPSA